MFQQDSNSVVFLKYSIDSSRVDLKANKPLPKKVFHSQSPAKLNFDTANQFKAYSPQFQTLNTDSFFADSTGYQNTKKKEFRFSDIDTIRAESFEKPGSSGPKLFSNHYLSPVHNSPQTYNKPNPDWFTIILFGIIFGFMWIRVFYYKILRQIINAFFNSSASNQIVRDENILIQRASVMLSIMFYLTAALFLYQVSVAFEWKKEWLTDGFSRLIIFAFLIAFAYSTKLILLKLIGYVLDIDKPVASYIFNIFLMNNILGLLLLPAVIVIAYVSIPFTMTLFWITISMVGIIFFYRIIRGIAIGMSIPKFSIFYLFLYLCAFEIAPLALIFKLAAG